MHLTAQLAFRKTHVSSYGAKVWKGEEQVNGNKLHICPLKKGLQPVFYISAKNK